MEGSKDQMSSDYVVGQDNIRVLGLDIHNPVFMVSAVLVVAFVVGTLVFLDSAGSAFSDMRVWITTKFDWMFMISMNIFVLFSLFIAFSKLGRVRLGGPDAKPRYGYPGWLAMLFAAGVGIGLRIGIPAGGQSILRMDLGVPLTGQRAEKGVVFRLYTELFGLLDRRAWPSQTERSRWYGVDPDLTTRPANPLAGN